MNIHPLLLHSLRLCSGGRHSRRSAGCDHHLSGSGYASHGEEECHRSITPIRRDTRLYLSHLLRQDRHLDHQSDVGVPSTFSTARLIVSSIDVIFVCCRCSSSTRPTETTSKSISSRSLARPTNRRVTFSFMIRSSTVPIELVSWNWPSAQRCATTRLWTTMM